MRSRTGEWEEGRETQSGNTTHLRWLEVSQHLLVTERQAATWMWRAEDR